MSSLQVSRARTGDASFRITPAYHFGETEVTRSTLLGSRTFAYDDAIALTWRERGAQVTITMTAANGKPFVVKLALDESLLQLRNEMSQRIAARLHQHWKHGDRIAWTSSAALTTLGLAINKRELVQYGEPLKAAFRGGHLVLYREQEPLATLDTSQENFYPGLALFEKLTPLTFTR